MLQVALYYEQLTTSERNIFIPEIKHSFRFKLPIPSVDTTLLPPSRASKLNHVSTGGTRSTVRLLASFTDFTSFGPGGL